MPLRNNLHTTKKKFKTLIFMLKIYFLYRNFTFNTGTKPTEKSPKRFKKTFSGACVRVLNSNFWQKYFHKSNSLLQLVPRTDVPEKKKFGLCPGYYKRGLPVVDFGMAKKILATKIFFINFLGNSMAELINMMVIKNTKTRNIKNYKDVHSNYG